MNNIDDQYFDRFFSARIKERGLNLKKLSEISGITVKHLEAFANGNFKILPSQPYFHGYLLRLGDILDFDGDFWWEKFKLSGLVKNSGTGGRITKSKFICPKLRKGFLPIAIVSILLIYLGLNFSRVLGKPLLSLDYPGQNPWSTNVSEVDLRGTLQNGSNLYINNESVALASDGSWMKKVLLEPGLNSLEIRARKFLGGETKLVEQVVYEPENLPAGQ